MNQKDLIKYATMYAAGSITEDALLSILGDDSAVSKIIAFAGAGALVAASDNIIDEVSETLSDTIDVINPFSW